MIAKTRQQHPAGPPTEAELNAQIDRLVDSAAGDVFSGQGSATRADARLDALLEGSLHEQSARQIEVPALPTDELRNECRRLMVQLRDALGQGWPEIASGLVRAWSEYARAEKEAIDRYNASGEGFDFQGAINQASAAADTATSAALRWLRVRMSPHRLNSILRRLGQLHYASTLPERHGLEYLRGYGQGN